MFTENCNWKNTKVINILKNFDYFRAKCIQIKVSIIQAFHSMNVVRVVFFFIIVFGNNASKLCSKLLKFPHIIEINKFQVSSTFNHFQAKNRT